MSEPAFAEAASEDVECCLSPHPGLVSVLQHLWQPDMHWQAAMDKCVLHSLPQDWALCIRTQIASSCQDVTGPHRLLTELLTYEELEVSQLRGANRSKRALRPPGRRAFVLVGLLFSCAT